MTQSHLAIAFPIKAPASAKALTEELPPLMSDFAKVQDDLGTVHFSRFMVKGDEKLLFLSDIDGEVDDHIERLVQSAGPMLDAILRHVEDPPAKPVASNPEKVIKWLKHHVREPIERISVRRFGSGHQGRRACGGLYGQYLTEQLADYMSFKSRLQGFVLKLVGKAVMGEKGHKASDAIGTLHVAHFVPFENNHLGFFTVYDGSTEKYFQDFADKTAFTFDALFPNVVGGAPTPVAKNAKAFLQWGIENNYPAIGFYSAYPGLSVQDIRALLADRKSESAA